MERPSARVAKVNARALHGDRLECLLGTAGDEVFEESIGEPDIIGRRRLDRDRALGYRLVRGVVGRQAERDHRRRIDHRREDQEPFILPIA